LKKEKSEKEKSLILEKQKIIKESKTITSKIINMKNIPINNVTFENISPVVCLENKFKNKNSRSAL
jgi:hypothetical protein